MHTIWSPPILLLAIKKRKNLNFQFPISTTQMGKGMGLAQLSALPWTLRLSIRPRNDVNELGWRWNALKIDFLYIFAISTCGAERYQAKFSPRLKQQSTIIALWCVALWNPRVVTWQKSRWSSIIQSENCVKFGPKSAQAEWTGVQARREEESKEWRDKKERAQGFGEAEGRKASQLQTTILMHRS